MQKFEGPFEEAKRDEGDLFSADLKLPEFVVEIEEHHPIRVPHPYSPIPSMPASRQDSANPSVLGEDNHATSQQLEEDADFGSEDEEGTFEEPEEDENPAYFSRPAFVFGGIISLIFSVLYFLEDTNGDAYIVSELWEYIMDTLVVSWITWVVGLGLNAIPNIPEAFLLFSLLMIKLQPLYLRRRQPETPPEIGYVEETEASLPTVNSSDQTNLFSFDSERREGSEPQGSASTVQNQLLPHHGEHHHHSAHHHTHENHHHHHHSVGGVILEIFLMGITPGALGFSASYIVLSSWYFPLRLVVSLGCGVVSGAADWIKHSYFNHEAMEEDHHHDTGNPPAHPLVRTFTENLFYTNHSALWKLHELWVKSITLIHHGGTGLFNFYAVLKVTDAINYLPWWLNMLIAGGLSIPSFVFEGISETYAYDKAKKNPHFQIHPVSKAGLIVGGMIHTLSFIVIASKIYQATEANNGEYYYLINASIFLGLSVFLGYPGTLSYYVMQKHPPKDQSGKDGICFDDIVRLLLGSKRPDRNATDRELQANFRFWRARHAEPRVVVLSDNEEETQATPVPPQQQVYYRLWENDGQTPPVQVTAPQQVIYPFWSASEVPQEDVRLTISPQEEEAPQEDVCVDSSYNDLFQ